VDRADRAYQYANHVSLLLHNGWHRPGDAQYLEDQRNLAIAEAKGVRCIQSPDHWSDLYKTENELWRIKTETLEKATSLSAYKAKRLSTLAWLQRCLKSTIDRLATLRFIGRR